MVLKEKKQGGAGWFGKKGGLSHGLEKRGVEATRAKRTNSLLIVEIPSSLI